MLALLASLYKDNTDSVVYQRRTGDPKQQFELAEMAAVARIAGMLYNLPDAIKRAGEALEQRKQHLDKVKQQQQPQQESKNREFDIAVNKRTYADKLAAEAVQVVERKEE